MQTYSTNLSQATFVTRSLPSSILPNKEVSVLLPTTKIKHSVLSQSIQSYHFRQYTLSMVNQFFIRRSLHWIKSNMSKAHINLSTRINRRSSETLLAPLSINNQSTARSSLPPCTSQKAHGQSLSIKLNIDKQWGLCIPTRRDLAVDMTRIGYHMRRISFFCESYEATMVSVTRM